MFSCTKDGFRYKIKKNNLAKIWQKLKEFINFKRYLLEHK